MTASIVPPVTEVAPGIVTRIKDGDLSGATMAFLAVGVIAVGVSLIGMGSDAFAFSYLTAYCFGLTICLGALFFVMIQHLVRAGWSVTVRRTAENIAASIWIFIPLLIPIIIKSETLYGHWLVEAQFANDAVILGKVGYLNETFFYLRLGLYFAAWILLSQYFRRTSLRQDETGNPMLSLRMSQLAAPGLLIYALSVTFASFDLIMSLNPHWFSTIFGICFFAAGFMASLALMIVLLKWVGSKGYLKDCVNKEHYHDLGKLMYAFVIFWTYVNFSQYMLIEYANLPEETQFYMMRKDNGWWPAFIMLAVGHFVAPFILFMSRHIKRHPMAPVVVAVWLLLMHWVDMQFQIVPNIMHVHHEAHGGHGGALAAAAADGHGHVTWMESFTWMDITTTIGVLALVVGVTLRNMRSAPIVPERDPRLHEALKFHNV